MKVKQIGVLTLMVLVVVALMMPVQARTISVCSSSCEFESIQGAVAAANAAGGDVISVGTGVFIGPVQVGITVDIVGGGAASVIVGGLIVGGVGLTVNVSGVTLTKGLNGLAILGLSTVIVQNATIVGNISDGVWVGDFSSVTLFNVVVANNGTNVAGNPIGAGISATGSGRVTTSIVTISGNVSGGIVAFGNATLDIGASTVIVGNGLTEGVIPGFGGEGVVVAGSASATIDGALIQGNGATGVAVLENGSATIKNSEISDNLGVGIRVGGPASVDPEIAVTASATIENNVISGNGSHGIMVGDPAKELESASATINSNGITGSGGCGIATDSAAATTADRNNFFSDNAEGSTCSL